MKLFSITTLVLAICFPIPLHGQNRSSTEAPFVGCYEVTWQKWHPGNEDATAVPIPHRFQLRGEPWDKKQSGDFFQMRSIPFKDNLNENLWIWQPKGDRLWLSWGTGFGGFRGTLNQGYANEFVGKIKEWCDSHCEWKKRAAKIRVKKISCEE